MAAHAKDWARRFAGCPKGHATSTNPCNSERVQALPLFDRPVARSPLNDASLRQEWLTSFLVLAVTIAAFSGYLSLLSFYAERPRLYPLSLLAVFAACLATSGVGYVGVPHSLVTLARGLAITTGIYSVLLFPGFPALHDVFGLSREFILIAWAAAGFAAIVALWRPSWLVYCGFYIFWIKTTASYVTGLQYHTLLDVQPLYQVPVYLGIALTGLQLAKPSGLGHVLNLTPSFPLSARNPWMLVLIAAIALHAANYFYSGVAKTSLGGGVTDWALHNENGNLFLVALYNKQLLWGDWAPLDSIVIELTRVLARPLAIMIVLGQLAAIAAFWNRRLLILLFAFYDLMHVGIFIIAGANFWTWFMLNLAIIAAMRQVDPAVLSWKTGAIGAVLIVASNAFASVAWLGWYDTRAVNSAYFEVVYPEGRTRLPYTAFGFYSYPLAHMSFGLPPGNYFPTLTNGGTYSPSVFRKSAKCRFDSKHSEFEQRWNAEGLTAFIRGYHDYVLQRVDSAGRWSDDLYPHHFWSSPSVVREFSSVDMRKVTAYNLVVDSVCLDAKGNVSRAPYHNDFQINVGE
jgi:hypothetical protein